ncbi:Hypothetical predicted protein [Olea europaea subsp. europaea]|uniref:DUF1985 domain-containing protein n=1 Tax=Olea europaea subsp. europaea TaxID=158383 RepID=A0A8S0S595_OLEEU|nr:Hypothetical predicted protein [Olea europaea subsp. europaea]
MYSCPSRISQRSNLKYVKTVMDHFDSRLRVDFRNSCLGLLVDVPEIQFSAQLILTLVCRGIHCDKSHELWFNVQGHLTQFGLQEYDIITRLHAGSFSEGDWYTKALEKRRLKEKYFKSLEKISCAQLEKTFVHVSTPQADRYKLGLALIVERVITALDDNVGIDEDTLSLVDNLELFFSTPGPKSVVEPQFHEAASANGEHDGSAMSDDHDDESGTRVEDDKTSASDDRQTPEGNGDDGFKADESGDSSRDTSSETGAGDTEDDEDASGRQSGALPTPMDAPSTSALQGTRGGLTMTREGVEGMLLDQHILIEMRLLTVKLEIIQHVIEEFARLRDFITTLLPSSGGTSTSTIAHVVNEQNIWDDIHEMDGEGGDERSPHNDDHADEGEIQEVNGGDERSPQDDNRAEEGEMQEVNGEIVPMLPSDDNEEAPSTHDVTEVEGTGLF